jgi:uncharacterized protein (TIGR00290 family)
MKRILLSWSSGKDSAWALHVLRQHPEYEIAGLLTTFNQEFDRVAMHGVRRELVEQQAEAAGLSLWTVQLPWPCSNEQYDALMAKACAGAIRCGIEAIAFGDLFLEDIRAYREHQLLVARLKPLFPLWGLPTHELAQEMISAGLSAKLTCVDTRKLDSSFAGRSFDESMLAEFSAEIDPCGERGEFHTFAHAGPMFSKPILVSEGKTVMRDFFAFADLLPR